MERKAELSLEDLLSMLRNGDIDLRGRRSKDHQEKMTKAEKAIREETEGINLMLRICFGEKHLKITEIYLATYQKIIAVYLRYKLQDPGVRMREDTLDCIEREMGSILKLFNDHNIQINAEELASLVTYGGYEYWKTYFEKRKTHIDPSLLRRAIQQHPKDPLTYATKIIEKIQAILGSEEFAGFRDKRRVVEEAARRWTEPEAALRDDSRWPSLL